MLNEILTHNQQFLQNTTLPHVGHAPRKQTAIVTCMDCRLVNMFEPALGLERGDVLELRTAGATISTPERAGAANDLIRSLAGGVYLLGVREIIVVGHTECGLSKVNPTAAIAPVDWVQRGPIASSNWSVRQIQRPISMAQKSPEEGVAAPLRSWHVSMQTNISRP